MKRNTFVLIFVFIGTLTFLQNVQANNINSLFTITITTVDHYVPGTTMDINFVLDYRTIDFDYGDFIRLTFPDGITPNSSPTDPFAPVNEGQDPEFLNGVSGQEISWGSNNNDMWGGIEIGVHEFIVNVTIDIGVTGDQLIDVLVSGAELGTPQPDINIPLKIQEFPEGPDLSVIAAEFEYTNYPLTQSNWSIIAEINNTGLELSSATELEVTCDLASYTETSAISLPLSTGGSQTFTLPDITPFTEGIHEIVFNATALDDPYLINNSDTVTIGVDTVYSHDDGGIAYTFGHQVFEYGLGGVFDIINQDEISAVQFYLGQTASVGNEFSLSVSPISINGSVPTLGNPTWQSDTLAVNASMLDSWTTVDVLNGALLDVGKYILIIHEVGSGSIELGFDGNPNGDLYRSYPGGADYFEDEAFGYPMLRLVLGTVQIQTDIDEIFKDEISIYPNPTNGIVNVENAENQNLIVYNMQGVNIVRINNASKIETIDISKYPSGSYIIKVGAQLKMINLIEE